MERREIQKFLHDLNNYLNAANLNACLLRNLHGEVLDQESIDRLDQALRDAAELTKALQTKVQKESATAGETTHSKPSGP
jgi:hypothetical protein